MNSRTKGIFCILSSAFCFALMSSFVRLAGDLPSVQKSFFRNLIAALIALILLLREHHKGEKLSINRRQLPLLISVRSSGRWGSSATSTPSTTWFYPTPRC